MGRLEPISARHENLYPKPSLLSLPNGEGGVNSWEAKVEDFYFPEINKGELLLNWAWSGSRIVAMDSFGSPSSSLPGSQPSSELVMDQLKQQLAQAYAEEFFSTVRDKCFTKCVTKPSTSLSGSESSCVSRCVERYIEATGIVSRAVFTAIPR